MKIFFCLFSSYFLGAIPFGWVLSKLVKGVDIRKMGSGRTGTTNTMRASGYPIAILTLLLDGFKGVVSVWLASWLAPGMLGLEIIAPIFAIVGHNYSVFLIEKDITGKLIFKGGAGGATALGGTFALMPSAFPIISAIALIMFFAVGYASLATLSIGASTLLLSVIQYLFGSSSWQNIVYGVMSTGLLVLALLPNITRLKNGTERGVSWRLGKN
ncbi:MAG TPA: glycerol-3-phosphate acyltransferase [Bellilinea sp.]|nr:glycerol-3-phosphate acyltransferase [Bellilinea sp.]